ncbi:MAG TPA: lysine--tRNA ligase [Candidatus Gracilibacteria bacterium]|nr:lysine--tRNA ligase [Candidatus Gracilibacteria bacterium]
MAKKKTLVHRRVASEILNAPDQHWGYSVADEVIRLFPAEEVYTCAAGISPSGIVHFGNFRDVMTSFAVLKGLAAKGKKVRFVFSWDDFDRFRKVPADVDPSFAKYIGMPLTAVPDPTDEYPSYAKKYEEEFVRSMKSLHIEMDYLYQTQEYTSGRYDEPMFDALRRREEIAETLLSFMSEKGKAAKNIDPDEYKKNYYPVSVYSRFSGKDSTEILSYDGGSKITYKCLETGKSEEVDLAKEHIAKLAWKIDWPMRWNMEHVIFEPGGHDHASPGGSYDTSSVIAQKIFNREPPVFAGYQFIGIQGLNGKMSGSKGNAISPADLLEIYEPQLLRWLYLRKTPEQKFDLAFDSEINRQYEEMDREVELLKKGELPADRSVALDLSFQDVADMPVNPIPFRQAVALGQIVQWQKEKVMELLEGLNLAFDSGSVATRLLKAKAWLETYNPEQVIRLRADVNREYASAMEEQDAGYVRKLREKLSGEISSIGELEILVYGIPKDPALTPKENSPRQRAFFKDVYNLLINADTGPRLATFLWAVDRKKVLQLLDIGINIKKTGGCVFTNGLSWPARGLFCWGFFITSFSLFFRTSAFSAGCSFLISSRLRIFLSGFFFGFSSLDISKKRLSLWREKFPWLSFYVSDFWALPPCFSSFFRGLPLSRFGAHPQNISAAFSFFRGSTWSCGCVRLMIIWGSVWSGATLLWSVSFARSPCFSTLPASSRVSRKILWAGWSGRS